VLKYRYKNERWTLTKIYQREVKMPNYCTLPEVFQVGDICVKCVIGNPRRKRFFHRELPASHPFTEKSDEDTMQQK